MSYVVAVLLLALGVAAVVYGGYDDAPGAQLIGVALVVCAVVLTVRAARRR
jgi:hypothetical protein